MKKQSPDFFLFIILFCGMGLGSIFPPNLYAQKYRYPKFQESAKQLQGFLPKGYTLIDSLRADLNQDGVEDWVWVSESQQYVLEPLDLMGVEKGTLSKPRILGIAFGEEGGNYRLTLQNNTFILRKGEGGMDKDPYQHLRFKPNQTIEIEFLRTFSENQWKAVYTWKYQDQAFALIRAETIEYNRMHGDRRDIIYDFVVGTIRSSYDNAMARRRRPQIIRTPLKNPPSIYLRSIVHPLSQDVIEGHKL